MLEGVLMKVLFIKVGVVFECSVYRSYCFFGINIWGDEEKKKVLSVFF